MRNFYHLTRFIVVLSLLFAFTNHVDAQDGLTPEEQILLDRIASAADILDSYTGYVESGVENTDFTLSGSLVGFNFNETQSYARTFETQVILTDSINYHSYQTMAVDIDSELDEETNATFELEAEMRYVNGVLYANASYLSAEGDYPELPDGWTILEESDDYTIFVDLEVNRFLTENQENLLRLALFEGAVAEILSEPMMLNGINVDVITVVINIDGIMESASEEDVEETETMGFNDFFGEYITLQVALDAQNNPLQVIVDFTVVGDGLGFGDFDEVLGEASTGLTTTYYLEINYDRVNEVLEPAAIPE